MLDEIQQEVKKLPIDKKWKVVKAESRTRIIPHTCQGSSISNSEHSATLGGFAKLERGNASELIALTAAHLLQTGDTALVKDGEVTVPLGKVECDTDRLTDSQGSYHDISVIKVDQSIISKCTLQYCFCVPKKQERNFKTAKVLLADNYEESRNPNMPVFKKGAVTGWTMGILYAVEFRQVGYGQIKFFKCITVCDISDSEKFSKEGDSGYLVCYQTFDEESASTPELVFLASVYGGTSWEKEDNTDCSLDAQAESSQKCQDNTCRSSDVPDEVMRTSRTGSGKAKRSSSESSSSDDTSIPDCTVCVPLDGELELIRSQATNNPNIVFDLNGL